MNSSLHEKSWLAMFGRSSYSFFLLHEPVIELLIMQGWFDGLSLYQRFFALVALGFAVTLPLSSLLYRYVEIGCQRYLRDRSAARSDNLLSPT